MPGYNLELKQVDNIPYLTSPKLFQEGSILVAFTTRHGGYSSSYYSSLNLAFHVGDNPDHVRKNRQKLCANLGVDPKKMTTADQVHSSNIRVVTEELTGAGALESGDAIPRTDALITDLTDSPLAVFMADCLPLVLVDPLRKVVAVVHAGWQGIYSDVVSKSLDTMEQSFASPPQDVIVFIGPGIGPCCYTVDSSMVQKFRQKFPFVGEHQRSLDLKLIARRGLVEKGVGEENIYESGICTSCRNDMFFSYRKERRCGRQAAIVAIM